MILLAPSPVADVLDRLTILAIKRERAPDRPNVAREHDALLAVWARAGLPDVSDLGAELARVNRALWDVEDRLRAAEARGDFGPAFVADARSVYVLNDRRAALKRSINERFGSVYIEEKVYG